MSSLIHTIHSATFIGAAPIAGAAYASPYVNQDQKGRKRRESPRSKRQAGNYDISQNVALAQQFSANGQIDDISNLQNSKVFVLHAQNDDAVPVYLAHEIKQFYHNISTTVNVHEDIGRNFGHIFPTSFGEPAMILSHLHGIQDLFC